MHRSKIEWCDDTWNPITGCAYNCRYCYSRKQSWRFAGDVRKNLASPQCEKEGEVFVLDNPFISETGGVLNYPFGFKPTYHKYRLNYPAGRKHGCNILVGESGEMFGNWISEAWICDIFEVCKQHEGHKYLFLTKNPTRYKELYQKGMLPIDSRFWYGCTMVCNGDILPTVPVAVNTFICIEPIQEEIRLPKNNVRLANWIIIGAESGSGQEKVLPEKYWIDNIVEYAERVGIPVFMKDSLVPTMGKEMKREYPDELRERSVSKKVKERLEGECCSCKVSMRKNEMIALCARSQRGEQPKQFTHICKGCFKKMCETYGIEVPALKALKE